MHREGIGHSWTMCRAGGMRCSHLDAYNQEVFAAGGREGQSPTFCDVLLVVHYIQRIAYKKALLVHTKFG